MLTKPDSTTATYPKPIAGKLYLHMYHGRNTREEALDDWGFDGPYIGPLLWYHVTYNTTARIAFEHVLDEQACNADVNLSCDFLVMEDGMLKWDGKYYGDWSVIIASEADEDAWELANEGDEHGN